MKVDVDPLAEAEMLEAKLYYNDLSENLGVKLLDEIEVVVHGILLWPNAHFEIFPGIRRALLRRYPYYIAYRVRPDSVQIVALVNRHRKPFYWVDRV